MLNNFIIYINNNTYKLKYKKDPSERISALDALQDKWI